MFAKRDERFDVKQLDASGLQPSGEIAWAVVGGENKRLQRRHLTRIERTPKLRGFLFLFRAVQFFRFRCLCAIAPRAKPGSGRAVLRPAGAADSCSARRLRKRRRTQGAVRLSSAQHVREANAFGLLRP